MADPVAARQLLNPSCLVALGFGSGLLPVAPGTAGTLAAIPLYLLLQDLPLGAYLTVVMVSLFGGILVCGYTAARLGVHDHPAIVWDEVVGYLVTMTAAPAGWSWLPCPRHSTWPISSAAWNSYGTPSASPQRWP